MAANKDRGKEWVRNEGWYRKFFGYVDFRDFPWAGFAWILFAALLYSLLVLFLAPDGEFWEWLSTLVATLLSVLGAVFLYRHQSNRAEAGRMYLLHMALDADLEALLTRLDPSRDGLSEPLTITLPPDGRKVSAYLSRGEDRVPMFEEVARSGVLQTRWESLLYFMLASGVRAYDKACDDYVALYNAASTAPSVGPNTVQAIVNAARIVEEMRGSLIENCEKQREYLADWLEKNKDFSPMGPEHDDTPVRWKHFVKPPQGSSDTSQEESESVDLYRQRDEGD